jgi:hypothetical protein
VSRKMESLVFQHLLKIEIAGHSFSANQSSEGCRANIFSNHGQNIIHQRNIFLRRRFLLNRIFFLFFSFVF